MSRYVVNLECLPAGTSGGSHQGKLSWRPQTGGVYAHNYSIPDIRECSRQVIAALNDLVVALTTPGTQVQVAVALRELARSGHELYLEVFNRNRGGINDARIARDWLKRQGPLAITIATDDSVHIPWGLLFEDDPNAIPAEANADIAAFDGFWCLRHDVRAFHSRHIPYEHECIGLNQINWLAVSHGVELSATLESLSALAAEEHEAWQTLCATLGESRYSVADLESTWEQCEGNFRFVYLFCHGNANELSFGPLDGIDAGRLSRRLQKRDDRRCPTLIFLNGCETAIGELGSGFLEATAGPGFCGTIGTEAKVPRLYAKRFAIAFFLEFLTTGSLPSEVMKVLRTRHWPFSLVYSLNAVDVISIKDPCKSMTVPTTLQRNICELDQVL